MILIKDFYEKNIYDIFDELDAAQQNPRMIRQLSINNLLFHKLR